MKNKPTEERTQKEFKKRYGIPYYANQSAYAEFKAWFEKRNFMYSGLTKRDKEAIDS